MKLKKAILVLIAAAIVVAIGGTAVLVLQYFSETAAAANSSGDLEIDYLIKDNESDTENTAQQESKNIYQWLIARLSADKSEVVEVAPQNSSITENGQRTTGRPSVDLADSDGQEIQSAAGKNGSKTTAPSKNAVDNTGKNDNSAEQQPEDSTIDAPDEEEKPSGDTVTMTIRCDTAVAKGMSTEAKWAGIVPPSGVILPVTTFTIEPGETAFSVLQRASKQYMFQMEYSGTNGSQYVEGINNLYEFDGGRWSGWMYCVNDWYPNYGCGQYALKNGDVIEWNYTCDLGKDLGQEWVGEDWTETHE